jgi:hypothetical protein
MCDGAAHNAAEELGMMRMTCLAALALALLLTACADGDDGAGGGDEPAGPLGVAEALEQGDGEVVVTGSLVVTGDEARLCEVLLESFPPQCGGPNVVVEGLDLDALPLQQEGDVAWSDGGVALRGVLDGDVLRDAEEVEGGIT